MNLSIRRRWLALSVVIVAAAAVAACGPVTTSEEAQPAGGLRAVQPSTSKLVQSQVCADGQVCAPTGAHAKHGAFDCKVCHAFGGWFAFQNPGPAYLPNSTGTPSAPSFDATTKTCSNVACHSVPPGTFSYYFPGGDGEPALNTVPYGGASGSAAPMWYDTALGCAACHGNPPLYNDVAYVWHSGFHGNQGPTGANNQCQLCHNDAVSTNGTATGLRPGNCNPVTGLPVTGTPAGSVPCASFHANGTVGVVENFTSACFGCH